MKGEHFFMKEFFSGLQSKDIRSVFTISFIILLIVIVIFFAIREVITWYYKIDRIVELLESIDEKLERSLQPPSSSSLNSNIDNDIESSEKLEASFTTRVKDTLTKEYHVKDLFSGKKDSDN
jgi:predicted PurR-regulated permease PerM